jgi:cobalamin synthase
MVHPEQEGRGMKEDTKWLVFKAGMIVIMLSLLLWFRFDQMSITVSMSIVVAMAAIMIMRKRYPERYQKDEMTRKIGAYSSAWSWMITLLVVTFLFWFDYLELMPLSASSVILIVFVTMISTVIVFRAVLMRRGF